MMSLELQNLAFINYETPKCELKTHFNLASSWLRHATIQTFFDEVDEDTKAPPEIKMLHLK